MNKLRAFLTHLAISATVVGTVLAVVFFVWYPHPYFQAIGAWNVVRVLIVVDLVIGPLLTLIVYKPKKPSLVFDMSVIAAIQLAALAYGVTTIFQERPYFAVFAMDGFRIIAAKDIDFDTIEDEALRRKPLVGPILVVASMPEDAEARERLMMEVLFENKPDIEYRPAFWHPYAERADEVLGRSRPLAELRAARQDEAGEIDRLAARHGRSIEELAFTPLVGRHDDLAVILDADSGMPIDALAVNPWLEPGGAGSDDPLVDTGS